MKKLIKGMPDWMAPLNENFAEIEKDKSNILNTIGSDNLNTNAKNIKSAINEVNTQLSQIVKYKIDWFNIKAFGAVGNGKIDDTAIIQGAIDYAYINGIQVIYFPQGTYKITDTIKLKNGISLTGDGYNTIIKAHTPTNMFELFDDSSVFCKVVNMCIDGNNIAPLGVFTTRKITNLGWDITRLYVEKVLITNCTSHGMQIGTISDKSNMEIVLQDVFFLKNGGYGLYCLHATDSFFDKLIARQNGQGGIYLRATNTKMSNCKSYANGYGVGQAPGYHITATMNTITNCEAQENMGDGFIIDSCTSSTLLGILADKNGLNPDMTFPTTPTYNGIKINNSNNILIEGMFTDSGKTTYDKYTQKYGIYLDTQCKNITINYGIKDVLNEVYYNSTTNNNIKLNKVGIEPIKFSILTPTATTNGVTFTKLSEDLLSINGNATSDSQYQMFGAFGNQVDYKIPFKAGQKITISLSNKEINGVLFYVIVNGNTVISATNWNNIYIPSSDGVINNLYIKVLSGTTLNNLLLTPQIIISD